MAAEPATLAGYGLAFGLAAGAIFYDCYTTLERGIRRVPGSVVRHPAVLGLCSLGGLIAAIVYGALDPTGGDVISTTLTLKQDSALWRGAAVGLTILVLLRSKLFNTQNSGFGGEWLYSLLRSLAVQSVNNEHQRARTAFLDRNIGAAFAIPTYFAQLDGLIRGSLATRPPEYQRHVEDQLGKAVAPATPMTQADPAWQTYYRTLTGICFDYCGPSILTVLPGFRT